MSKIKFEPNKLEPKIHQILTEFANSYTNGIVEIRAQAILELWNGKSIKAVSWQFHYNRQSIGKFRKRFQENAVILNTLSLTEEITFAELKREVKSVLSDLHRTGRHLEYSLDQRARIIGIACLEASGFGFPESHMTVPLIREATIKLKVVDEISLSTVWRILNEAHIKPHKTHSWLNSGARIKDEEEYDRRVREICSLYIEVANSEVEEHTYFYCLDEKTGIQALERRAPDKLVRPHKSAKLEHGYIRHGFLICLELSISRPEKCLTRLSSVRSIKKTTGWILLSQFFNLTLPVLSLLSVTTSPPMFMKACAATLLMF